MKKVAQKATFCFSFYKKSQSYKNIIIYIIFPHIPLIDTFADAQEVPSVDSKFFYRISVWSVSTQKLHIGNILLELLECSPHCIKVIELNHHSILEVNEI